MNDIVKRLRRDAMLLTCDCAEEYLEAADGIELLAERNAHQAETIHAMFEAIRKRDEEIERLRKLLAEADVFVTRYGMSDELSQRIRKALEETP